MSAEAVAIVGVGVALPAVRVPLLLTVAARLQRRIDALAAELASARTELRADVAEVRRDLHAEATAIRADVHALAERVARIEGTMSGPWRPTNGSPAPSTSTAPEATP